MRSGRGFTLPELLVVAAITIIAGTLLVGILVNHNGVLYKENTLVEEGMSLNDVSREIDESLRQSTGISDSFSVDGITYTTDTETLVFKLSALSDSGIIENVYDYGVITKDGVNNKILKLKIFPDNQSIRFASDKTLITNLASLQFNYTDKNGQAAVPSFAVTVGVNLGVLSQTGAVSSGRSVVLDIPLRNAAR